MQEPRGTNGIPWGINTDPPFGQDCVNSVTGQIMAVLQWEEVDKLEMVQSRVIKALDLS